MRYYSTQRPVMPGSYPAQEKVKAIHNFDKRTFCPEIGREAWGYIDYDSAISEEEGRAYELVKEGEKSYWCVMITVSDSGRVASRITNVIYASEQPENHFTSTSRRDIYVDWFDSREEAVMFAAAVADA